MDILSLALLSEQPSTSRAPRFAVLQMGARLHYAIPALLERNGMLEAFYTDSVGSHGPLSWARLVPPRWRHPALRRLLARKLPPDVSPRRVVSLPGHAVLREVRGLLGSRSQQAFGWQGVHQALREKVLRENFRGANALYILDNSDLPLARRAREQGFLVVYEQICSPEIGRILHEERDRFPGLERQDSWETVESGVSADLAVWKTSDLVLSCSPYVSEGIARLGGDMSKVALVPYGVADDWTSTVPATVPKRVLFAGLVGLLKGSHYFAEAQRILARRGHDFEFRAVGRADPAKVANPLFRGPTYVGHVPRDLVRQEFSQADVFVMPSLSDGFALVQLEAMACGVPVVATPHCGALVRDDVEGYVVPIRDATAIADAVERIVLDRSLRARMSEAARARAKEFTWQGYEKRLMGAILEADRKRASR